MNNKVIDQINPFLTITTRLSIARRDHDLLRCCPGSCGKEKLHHVKHIYAKLF